MATSLFFIALGAFIGIGFYFWIDKNKEHTRFEAGAPEQVNWLCFRGNPEEGIIRLRDGAFMATYSYKGQDLHSATEPVRSRLTSELNSFFGEFEGGHAFYFTMLRSPATGYPGGSFPDPITAGIDHERREKQSRTGSHYHSVFYMSVVWKPEFEADASDFRAILSRVEQLAGRLISPSRLDDQAHLSYLYRCMHGIDQPITPPPSGDDIACLLANQEIEHLPFYDKNKDPFKSLLNIQSEDIVLTGDKYVRSISINGYPGSTHAGILNVLNEIDGCYRWTTRVACMDREEQEKKIEKKRTAYRTSRKGLSEVITGAFQGEQSGESEVVEAMKDETAVGQMLDTKAALSELKEKRTNFVAVTITVVLHGDDWDSVKATSQQVLSAVREAGFTATVERHNAIDGWIGSLPSHDRNIRKQFISTRNLADIIPTWSRWRGPKENPNENMHGAPPHYQAITAGNEPFSKHRPIVSRAGHSIMVGATGGGKSTYVNFEIAQWRRHENAQIFLFDLGYTGELLCRAAGGSHYDLLNDSGVSFQPYRNVQPGKNSFESEWTESLCKLQGLTLTPQQKRLIKEALSSLASMDTSLRTMNGLITQVQDQQVKEALRIYSREGKYGRILDSATDSIKDNDYQVFELETLNELSDEIILPVLSYLFHRVEQSLSADRPTLIYIEEAWAAFSHEDFQDRLKQWLVSLRKKNAHVCLVTHGPEQLDQLKQPKLFTQSTPEWVFLPNPDAVNPKVRQSYREVFTLNDSQLDTIARIKKRKEYYIVTEQNSCVIDLDLQPLCLSFITRPEGMSISRQQAITGELQGRYGERWPLQWLHHIGNPEQADFLESFYQTNHQPNHKPQEATL